MRTNQPSFSSNLIQRSAGLKRFSQRMSLVIGCLGLLGLLSGTGQTIFADNILPNLIDFKFYSAISLILSGLTLGLWHQKSLYLPESPQAKILKLGIKIGGFLIILIACLTLFYHVLCLLNFHSNLLLFSQFQPNPNGLFFEPMETNTALVFLMLGVALLLLNTAQPDDHLIDIIVISGGLISFIGLLTHIYSNVYFYTILTPTEIPLLLLCSGILSARPHQGLMLILVGDGMGSHVNQLTIELQTWKQRYEVAVELSGQLLYEYDLLTQNHTWGNNTKTLLGYDVAEMPQTIEDYFGLIHPDDRKYLQEAIETTLIQNSTQFQFQYQIRHQNGSYIWIEDQCQFWSINGESPTKFIGFLRDISEQKQIEIARSQIAAIVESSDDAIISKTLEGIIISWNAGAERLFGYTAAEILGQPISILLPPERYPEESEILKHLVNGERIQHFETVRKRKDGSLVDISITVSLVKNKKGEIIGASKIARDISEQKRIESHLRESEERFRSAFENASIGMAILGLEGQWLRVNQALCVMLGYSQAELLNLTFQEITHSDDLETDLENYYKLLNDQIQTYQSEKRYIHKQGQIIWILLNSK